MNRHAYQCKPCGTTFEFELKAPPKRVPCPSCGGAKTAKAKAAEGTTGTYRFSRELQTTVRVSDRVPGLTKPKGMPKGPSCPPQGCGRCH